MEPKSTFLKVSSPRDGLKKRSMRMSTLTPAWTNKFAIEDPPNLTGQTKLREKIGDCPFPGYVLALDSSHQHDNITDFVTVEPQTQTCICQGGQASYVSRHKAVFPFFFRAQNEVLGRCWEISEASPAPFGRPRGLKTVSEERPAEQFRSEGGGFSKNESGKSL